MTDLTSDIVLTCTELSVINGTAQAVWEVITTNPAAIEALSFGVWQRVQPGVGANSPPGTVTVNMSYAPTAPGAFSYGDGPSASSSLPVARFVDTSVARHLFRITPCERARPSRTPRSALRPHPSSLSGRVTGAD
jgi:hypothetical protein